MDSTNIRIKVFLGSIIVIILEVFLSPIISINSVAPNFLLAFTIACVVSRPDKYQLVFAFIMGLIFDLICNGPVGAMSFAMVVFSYIVAKILSKVEDITFPISLLTIIVSVFFVELFYSVFQVSMSADLSFVDVLSFRVLPCTLYDVILSVIMFPIMVRFLSLPVASSDYNAEINSRW